ncbi:UNVERIFIED_CONTAM: hypothetical protein FKN15_075285 [Acipenser sinensis]
MIPLTYKWERESGGGLPPTAIQNPGTGILLIQNHTKSFSGSYRCTVRNAVGEEQCVLSLGVSPCEEHLCLPIYVIWYWYSSEE